MMFEKEGILIEGPISPFFSISGGSIASCQGLPRVENHTLTASPYSLRKACVASWVLTSERGLGTSKEAWVAS